ncbi:MAG: hypothetical protein ACLSAP_01005 [Oscillospiraceae bacterium]
MKSTMPSTIKLPPRARGFARHEIQHYAPKARVTIVDGPFEAFAAYLRAPGQGRVCALLLQARKRRWTYPASSMAARRRGRTGQGLFARCARSTKGAERVAPLPQKQGVAKRV